MGEDFYRKQRELMTAVVAESDVVITTANIPGKKAPTLITEDMVKAMPTGSVLVDLAAERGGNCELTESGQTVVKHGVTIMGPENIPAMLAENASTLYSKNITTFFATMANDGEIDIDYEDEIISSTMVTRDGTVPNGDLKERLGL
jgi:NAD(P) transhydrogenase subunit alpha